MHDQDDNPIAPTTVVSGATSQSSTSPDDGEVAADTLGDPGPSMAVSLCFWATLMFAVSLYAVVALAPKLAVWAKANREHSHNLSQLSALENRVEYLERVDTALETDPEFVENIAGVQSGKSDRPGTAIPVSGSLMFGHDESAFQTSEPAAPAFWERWAFVAASHRSLRTFLLVSSACLTLFAFTFLNDAGSNLVFAAGRLTRAAASLPLQRYLAAETLSEGTIDASDSSGQPQPKEDSRNQ